MSNKRIFSNDDIIEIKRLTSQDGLSSRKIAEIYGVGKSTIGDLLRKETYTEFWEKEEDKPTAGGYIKRPEESRRKLKGKRFVFTSAQNNTYVHDGFLKALEVYCKHNNSELMVGTYIYNKKGFQSGATEDTWFDPKIRDYIVDESCQIAEGLVWSGELNILPTAKNPMSGMQNYVNQESCIIPHAKLQMLSLPAPLHTGARFMYTTGTVTQRQYRPQKAGQLAEHHHSFSALVVEIDDDGDWFVRQLSGEKVTGNFYDIANGVEYYTREGVTDGHCVAGINWGDIHAAKVDEDVAETSWGKGGIIDILKPSVQFLHDFFDMKNRNHHNINDPYFKFKMHVQGTESVLGEIIDSGNLMKTMLRPDVKTVVVQSNHDLALQQYLRKEDYRGDPVNAEFFLEMQLKTYQNIRLNKDFCVLEYAMKKYVDGLDNVEFIDGSSPYKVAGISKESHGSEGNNGSRPSTATFRAWGCKVTIGHQHAANILDGVWVAGVSGKLDMGYNAVGGSSWSHSHVVTYLNGKRVMITLKQGKKWRGDKNELRNT